VLNLISCRWLSPPETSGFAPSLGAFFMPDEQTKVCSRCKKEKLHWQFGANKQQKDGLSCYCKQCVIERDSSPKTKALRKKRDIKSGRIDKYFSKL
jgi:hypothetical protein